MIIIGIDPGVSGAIAALDTSSGIIRFADMPAIPDGVPVMRLVGGKRVAHQKNRVDGRRLHEILSEMSAGQDGVIVALESIVARPEGNRGADGERRGNSMQSQAVMIGTRYAILAVCDVLALDVREITPQVWKKAMWLGQDKDASRKMACKLYPVASESLARVKDHGRAEALLLAHYAKRWYSF